MKQTIVILGLDPRTSQSKRDTTFGDQQQQIVGSSPTTTDKMAL